MLQRLILFLALISAWMPVLHAADNLLEIPDLEASPGINTRLPIMLRNQDPVTAIELTLEFDYQGWYPSYDDLIRTERLSANHTAAFNVTGNFVKILIYSADNTPISGNDGAVVYLPITVDYSGQEGDSYPVKIREYLLVRPDGTDVATGSYAGSVSIRQVPDLTPLSVSADRSLIEPGDSINVCWDVANIGSADTYSGFRASVELHDTNDNYIFLGEYRYDSTIAAGSSLNINAPFRIPTNPGLHGDLFIRVTLYPYSDCGESILGRDNNSASSDQTITLADRLLIDCPYNTITEGDENVWFSVWHTGSTDSPLEVRLSVSPADARVVIPESVTIPQYENTAFVTVKVLADSDYQPDTTFTITASAQGMPDATSTFCVSDGVQPAFTLTEAADEINEGEKMTFTLSRNIRPSTELDVQITCDRPQLFRYPAVVSFPAGSTSTTFEVEAINNTAISVARSVLFQASAPGYESSSTYVTLIDDDMPDISLSLSPSTVGEDAGPTGVVATVKRLNGSTDAIELRISSDHASNIYHESTVSMAKGQNELTFPIGIIDNAEVDGDRLITLTAAIYSSDCGCWAGETQKGYVQSQFTVTDNDGPSLSISSPASLAEGKEMTVSVSRNTPASAPLNVSISHESDSDTNLVYPASVTIPAGAASTSFTVKAPANDRENDSSLVALYAESDGFSLGSCRFMLTDASLPDAVITSVELSATDCTPGQEINVSVTVANDGAAILPAKVPVAIILDGRQTSTAYTMGSISPGASETVIKTVTLPSRTGKASIKASVNANNSVAELISYNNESAPVAVEISADVRASLNFGKERYLPGETIEFSGRVERGIKPGESIDVILTNGGLSIPVRVATTADGSFKGNFTPYKGRWGGYTVAVAYPGDSSASETLAAFDVVAFNATSSAGKEEVDEGESFTHRLSLSNNCSFPLTGIKAATSSPLPEGILSVDVPSSIAAGEKADLIVSSTTLAASPGDDWLCLPITVTSAEGAELDYTLYYFAHSLRGNLSLSESSVSTTMTKDAERLYTVTLANNAMGETGPVTVQLPDAKWLSLASPSNISSLKGGESVDITFRLTPTADMQLNNPVSAVVAVNAENSDGVTLRIKAEPVSEATGTLLIDVCDEYTYNTAGSPHVEGATVTVMHPATRRVLHTLTTGPDGTTSLEIPEGYYYVSVTEPRHESFAEMLLVNPGRVTSKTINLSVEGITVDVKYEKTEIEDVYDIVTRVTYETNVPAPVIETIFPDPINIDALSPGESILFNVEMVNRGLITAANTALLLEDFDDPEYTFTPLVDMGFELLPGTSVTIPVMVSRAKAAEALRPVKRAPSSGNTKCSLETYSYCEAYCGPDKKIHTKRHEFRIRTCYSQGPAGGSGTGGSGVSRPQIWPSGGGLNGGGVPPKPGTSVAKTKTENKKAEEWADKFESFVCDPCVNSLMDAVAECNDVDPDNPIKSILKRIPVVGDAIDCGFSLYECRKKDNGTRDWNGCGDEFFGCALSVCKAVGGILQKYGVASTATGVGAAPGAGMATAGKILEVTCDILSNGKDALECAGGLKKACPKKTKDLRNAPRAIMETDDLFDASTDGRYPSYAAQYLEKLDRVLLGRRAMHTYYEEILGNEQFLQASTMELDALFAALAAADPDEPLDADEMLPYAPECVEEAVFRAFIDRQNNTMYKKLGQPYEGDTIDLDLLQECRDRIRATVDYARSLGYPDVKSMMNAAIIEMEDGYNDKSGSVCSSVTIELEQRMTMTRQAIRGTLTVVNGHESETLTDFRTYLRVYDEDGELAGSDRLQIAVEDMEGFSGEMNLESGWSLPHDSEGVAKVLFIPTKKAAPEKETFYTFTGEVTYLDPFSGLEVTRQLTPATLSISPSPELHLSYFMQRDVMGDDPLTPNIIEASVPAEFALVVANKGKGDANNVSLSTASPRIVDNEKGLALELAITESYLNGEPVSIVPDENIVNDFGTIPSGESAYAQWMISSNLLGHFTSYDVEATHVSSYGNPDLSLLDGVEIHELILGMTLPAPEEADRKAVRAFVANDVVDSDDAPDRIYFSDARPDETVFTSADATIETEGLSGILTLTPRNKGWQYFRIADPTFGMKVITGVVRESDGMIIPADNFRQTDRTLRDGREPVYEYMLAGCLEADGTERYRLSFEQREETPLKVMEWRGLPAADELSREAVEIVEVRFNAPVAPDAINPDAIRLIHEGRAVNLSTPVAVESSDSPDMLRLRLNGAAASEGFYQLSLNLAMIHDMDGKRGAGSALCSWLFRRNDGLNLNIAIEPADAGNVTGLPAAVNPGEQLELKAIANEGYTFVAWRCDEATLSTNPSLPLTPEHDMALTAIFAPISHEISISVSDELGGDLTGAAGGIYPHGSKITLAARPTEGWHFSGWFLNDEDEVSSILSAEAEFTLTVESAMSIMARFERNTTPVATSHELSLRKGWNWVAFPLHHDLFDNPAGLLAPLQKDVTAIAGVQADLRRDGDDWIGTLSSVSHREGYRMLMEAPSTLHLDGLSLTDTDLTVTLAEGWNLIGTPLRESVPLNEALDGMIASEGDVIVAHDMMALYNGSEWVGSLSMIEPGAAYMVNVAERTTFNWPLSAISTSTSTAVRDRHLGQLSVDPTLRPHSMGIVIRLEADIPIAAGSHAVAAFDAVSGECLGISEEHDGLHFLVVHGDSESPSAFIYKAVEIATGEIKDMTDSEPTMFAGGASGSIANPVLLTIGNSSGVVSGKFDALRIYPNPVKDTLHISGLDDSSAVVTIIDNDGRIHMRHNGLDGHTTINLSDLAGGIYRLIVSSSGSSMVKSIVKE